MEIFSKYVYKFLNKTLASSFLIPFTRTPYPTLTIFRFLPPPPLFFKFRRCSRRCPAAWADPLFSSTVSHSSPFFFNFFAVFVFRRTRRRTAVLAVRFGHFLVFFMLFLLAMLFSHYSFLLGFSVLLTFGNGRFPARWRRPAVLMLLSFILDHCKHLLLLSCFSLRFQVRFERGIRK